MPEQPQAIVGLGANLGDRWATLQAALGFLRETPGVAAVEASPVFETDPVGVLDQPLFLNLVAGVTTSRGPEALLQRMMEIELRLGRQRAVRWGPRTIDLDLLWFAGETRVGPVLELPHPRMFERAFVVEPLRELLRAPSFQGPAWAELRARVAALPRGAGVRPWAPPR
ncbi:MAG: 2-amino-4-hydroxy-6-hydroxymethyldihydropteridine diphosphokinase [Opitutae bacterium]|nr:2-amino-4-hydroxy-6-hydroxymethyldihydropteridine diphosphokinase [Opitutae bacterium]